MDKFASMKAFTAVAERGSFSAAAEVLRMSKAMASKHVGNLEKLLRVRLIHRNTRGLRLTEVGEAYRDQCKQILAAVEEAEHFVTQLNSEPRGTLRVTAPPFLRYVSPHPGDRGLRDHVHRRVCLSGAQ